MTILKRTNRKSHASLRTILACCSLLTVAIGVLVAHEGHAALPTKGVQIDLANGHLLLTSSARNGLDVATADVESKSVEGKLLAYAQIELPWKNHGFATSRLPGRVVKVHVSPGQIVRAGEIIAEVQSLELDTLQLEALTAQTEAALGEKVVKDLRSSVNSGAIPGQSLIDAELKLSQANNSLVVVRSKWLALGLSSESLDTILKRGAANNELTLPVRVPVAGTVIHAELTLGKYGEPNEHLAEVADLASVWVRVGVLEKDLHRVTLGTPVDVRLVAYPGEVFRTVVNAVAPYLDPTTHLASVWAELTNPSGVEPRFVPGMAGRADLILSAEKPRPTVPVAAVIKEGLDQFIFVEEANAEGASEYRKKSVALGRRSDGRVEIVSGDVFPGDRVVTRGAHELGGLFAPAVLRPGSEAARSIGLRVEAAASGTIENIATLDGAVELPPSGRGSATAPVAGVIASIRTDRGKVVKAGEILAELSSPELQTLQLELIRTNLDLQAETALFNRIRDMDSIPRRRVMETESRVVTLSLQLDTLRRKLITVGLASRDIDNIIVSKQVLSTLPIRSPLDGVVVTFDKALGQAVTSQELLFAVHDLSKPWVMGFVSERDVARVRIGQSVRIRLVSDPSVVLSGKVARSGRTIGVDSRSLTVWVELIGEKAPSLVHVQLATLSVVTGSGAAAVTVPLGAVGGEPGANFVFIRRLDGVFDRRSVETGSADDRRVAIVRGLEAGELVAVAGVDELAAGLASLK